MKKFIVLLLSLILLFSGCDFNNTAEITTSEFVTESTALPSAVVTLTPSPSAVPTSTPTPTIQPTPDFVGEPPYFIKVNVLKNTVAVYSDEVLIRVFTCSVGIDDSTPLGLFYTSNKYTWRSLYGGTYGQYATRIYGSILFHSVPYKSMSKDSLDFEEYNKLGTNASLGCVRLTVGDCKWIYDNCPSGTMVLIYEDNDESLSPESVPVIDISSPYRFWDPTDPDDANPWRTD